MPPPVTRVRFGCSNLITLLFLAAIALLFFKWSSIIDARGAAASASITEKRENVRETFGNWFRQFQIVAVFRPPENPFDHHAICDFDQSTYDSLHTGDRVTVHYFPPLITQPFIPAAHLSPCTAAANFGSNPDFYRRLLLVFGSVAAIVFLFLVLRIRIAAWLLVPWFGLFIMDAVTPHAEPAPVQPRPAMANVKSISTIDEILVGGEGEHRHSAEPLKLTQPYQLVQLEFTPDGASGPVVALDTVDLHSIALQPKQLIDIDYDAANPRIARIRGGTRTFPDKALHELMLVYGVIAAFFVALFVLSLIPRLLGRTIASYLTGLRNR